MRAWSAPIGAVGKPRLCVVIGLNVWNLIYKGDFFENQFLRTKLLYEQKTQLCLLFGSRIPLYCEALFVHCLFLSSLFGKVFHNEMLTIDRCCPFWRLSLIDLDVLCSLMILFKYCLVWISLKWVWMKLFQYRTIVYKLYIFCHYWLNVSMFNLCL